MRLWLFAVTFGLIALRMAVGAERPGLPGRLERSAGEFVIEYSAGDEPYADALAARLPEFTLEHVDAAAIMPLTNADLTHRREEFLGRVAAFLALPAPLPETNETLDRMIKLQDLMSGITVPPPRLYALWDRHDLTARLRAGQTIAGFTLKGENLDFEFQFSSGPAKDASIAQLHQQIADAWARLQVPLEIHKEPNRSATEEIDRELGLLRQRLGYMHQLVTVQILTPFTVLHEATEMTVVTHYLTSADRRWFCDGVANYVAYRVLVRAIGENEARRFYDLDAELQKFASVAADVDLQKWPAAENLAKAGYAENLNTANYAFATKAIATICARHGDDLLPRLFAEIGKTPRAKTSMKTVYAAFRKLTGEDMRTYLKTANPPPRP